MTARSYFRAAHKHSSRTASAGRTNRTSHVGVSRKALRVPKVDNDYFEDA